MTSLWLGCAGLLLLASFFLIVPLFFKRHAEQVGEAGRESLDIQQDNVLIFRERLEELGLEQQQGTLGEQDYQALKIELEKTLLQDVSGKQRLEYQQQSLQVQQVVVVFSLILLLMFSSVIVYLELGRSEDYGRYLAKSTQQQEIIPVDDRTNKAPDFSKAIKMLRTKIKENPEDIDKYILLSNSYMAIGDYQKATEVYKALLGHLDKQNKDYAFIKGSYAQALFQAQGEKFTEEVNTLIAETLTIDEQESTVLILRGIQVYMQGDYVKAIDFWQRSKIKADKAQISRFIEPAIADALAKSGVKSVEQSNNIVSVIVNVSIAAELKALVRPEHTVFVFARAVGGRMPLAIERIQVKDLPKRIVLDDSKAAMPTATLSSVDTVDIIARVSLSGTPKAQKGDLYIEYSSVSVLDKNELILVINKVQK